MLTWKKDGGGGRGRIGIPEFTKKKKKGPAANKRLGKVYVAHILMHLCTEAACACVLADVLTVDGPLSSIKKMSGLINHVPAHPLRGGRPVT